MKKTVLEAGVLALAMVVTSTVFVTVIGYFDEGHHLVYAGFVDYLLLGGHPPLSDYLLWTGIFTFWGGLIYLVQGLSASFRERFFFKLSVAVVGVPVFVLSLLLALMASA